MSSHRVKATATSLGPIGLDRDPYFMPPHVELGFDATEKASWIAAFQAIDQADGDGDGFVPTSDLPGLLEALGEKPTKRKCAQCVAAVDPHGRKCLGFLPLSNWVARLRLSRDAKGRKRCIDDKLPLPPCYACEACAARMVPRDRREKLDNPHDPARGVLYTIFCRHDDDGSGTVDMGEVKAVLAEHNVDAGEDEEGVARSFAAFDVDGSGTLNFDEFCELMFDLKAEGAIVKQRLNSTDLPPELEAEFSPNDIVAMRHHFGLFDANGDGTIDADELRDVLGGLGTDASPKQIKAILEQVDSDNSGSIEFKEFAELMDKVNKGKIQVGASLLAQAVLDTKSALKLMREIEALQKEPPEGGRRDGKPPPHNLGTRTWIELLPNNPPTAEVRFYPDGGTPYDGALLRMHVRFGEDYPFGPPWVRFSRRVLHANFLLCLDGKTQIEQVLARWDATWDLRTLVDYVIALLNEPDPGLFPEGFARGTRLEEAAGHSSHVQPPGFDLREKPRSNKLTAELLHTFLTDRPRYEQLVQALADKFLERQTDEPLSYVELERQRGASRGGKVNDARRRPHEAAQLDNAPKRPPERPPGQAKVVRSVDARPP